jgi:hypothetical protein
LKTTIGKWLSRQSEIAVESMTPKLCYNTSR